MTDTALPPALTRRDLGKGMLLGWLGAPAAASAGATHTPSHPRWCNDFRALRRPVNGHPLAYLDSAATTQRPEAVIEALAEFYRNDNANPSSALHSLAQRAYERYEQARRTVASFINAETADEIVWVRGTTEGINLVASAWARPMLHPGDQVLLSVAEHASNLLPWRLVAEQTGATVEYVDVDDEGRLVIEDLERKLTRRTRILAFSYVSNVTGYISPAAQFCARAHEVGARVLIDAAQAAPHIPIDVRALGCDFLAFSSHKMLGPMGVGVLWGRRELLEPMPPYQAGSNMAHEIDRDGQIFEHAARKFGAGTPNVSGAVGLAAAIGYLRSLGSAELTAHERDITGYALEHLRRVPGLRILGPVSPAERVPVFSFVLANHSPQQIVRSLDERGIAIRAGDLAALPLLRRFGLSAAARASCYVYTTREEIERLANALEDLAHERTGASG